MNLNASNELAKLRLYGYATIIFLFLTFLVWGSIAKLNGAVIAAGTLEVLSHKQIVQHQDGGRIKELLVKNGDTVNSGDVLLKMEGDQVLPEYEIYNRRYIESLAEKGRLIAERDVLAAPAFPAELLELEKADPIAKEVMSAQTGLFEYRREANQREIELLNERKSQAEQKLDGASAQLDSLKSQHASLQEEFTRNSKLIKQGLIGKGALSNIERQVSQTEGSLGQLNSDIASVKDEQSAIEIELLKQRSKPREEAIARIRELENTEVEYLQRRNLLAEKLKRLDITAPLSGKVYGMTVFGSDTVIGAGVPILYIVPSDDTLIIRAKIPVQDINDVYVGQDCELKFTAYNQRTLPYISGKVKTVSADAIIDEKTGVQYYELEITPEADVIKKIGVEELSPGQPVEAFVHTGSRTFFDYLLKPIMDNFSRAFREH